MAKGGRAKKRRVKAPHSIRRVRKSLEDMSGVEFEAFLAQLFKRLGYRVQTTKASGDFGADLLLSEPGGAGRLIAVQAKHVSSKVGVAAVQEVSASQAHYGADACWVVTSNEFTEPAKRLADDNGVMLVDGSELAKLMDRAGLHPVTRKPWIPIVLVAALVCAFAAAILFEVICGNG